MATTLYIAGGRFQLAGQHDSDQVSQQLDSLRSRTSFALANGGNVHIRVGDDGVSLWAIEETP